MHVVDGCVHLVEMLVLFPGVGGCVPDQGEQIVGQIRDAADDFVQLGSRLRYVRVLCLKVFLGNALRGYVPVYAHPAETFAVLVTEREKVADYVKFVAFAAGYDKFLITVPFSLAHTFAEQGGAACFVVENFRERHADAVFRFRVDLQELHASAVGVHNAFFGINIQKGHGQALQQTVVQRSLTTAYFADDIQKLKEGFLPGELFLVAAVFNDFDHFSGKAFEDFGCSEIEHGNLLVVWIEQSGRLLESGGRNGTSKRR
jgi:hypothetical protein